MSAKNTESLLEKLWLQITLRLQDPAALRITILTMIGVVGLGGFGIPLCLHISALKDEFTEQKQHALIIKQNKSLVEQVQRYRARIPKDGDTDWWVEYLTDKMRECQVKPGTFMPAIVKGRKIGSLDATLCQCSLEATYPSLIKLVGTLENSKYLVRLNTLSTRKDRAEKIPTLHAQMSLAFLVSPNKAAKKAPAAGKKGAKDASKTESPETEINLNEP